MEERIRRLCIKDTILFTLYLSEYIGLYTPDHPATKTVVLCGENKIVARVAPRTKIVFFPSTGTLYVDIEGEETRIELDMERLVKYLSERLEG